MVNIQKLEKAERKHFYLRNESGDYGFAQFDFDNKPYITFNKDKEYHDMVETFFKWEGITKSKNFWDWWDDTRESNDRLYVCGGGNCNVDLEKKILTFEGKDTDFGQWINIQPGHIYQSMDLASHKNQSDKNFKYEIK